MEDSRNRAVGIPQLARIDYHVSLLYCLAVMIDLLSTVAVRPRASSPNMRSNPASSLASSQAGHASGKGKLPMTPTAGSKASQPTTLKKSSKSPFGSIFKRSRSKTLGSDSASVSSGMATPPVPTPQLSFSSSTTSTLTSAEPSDQFYADFVPDQRPTYGGNGAMPTAKKNGGGFSMFGKKSKLSATK